MANFLFRASRGARDLSAWPRRGHAGELDAYTERGDGGAVSACSSKALRIANGCGTEEVLRPRIQEAESASRLLGLS
jgi:hypothetical protein